MASRFSTPTATSSAAVTLRDILGTGIDHLVKTGKVDPKRQFVYGSSYGGFMTSWLVAHTKQFRAAVKRKTRSPT